MTAGFELSISVAIVHAFPLTLPSTPFPVADIRVPTATVTMVYHVVVLPSTLLCLQIPPRAVMLT